MALIFTIALGIGSNVAVHGFARGLTKHDFPQAKIDRIVSVFRRDVHRSAGPLSYDEYLSFKKDLAGFEWIGAASVSPNAVQLAGQSLTLPIAAITPEVAELLSLPLNEGVIISNRLWRVEFGASANVVGQEVRIRGANARVTGVAPDWLQGVYRDHLVDIWMPLRDDAIERAARGSRTFWALGRLRKGVLSAKGLPASGEVHLLPYTGMMPDAEAGLSRVGAVLGLAAGAVFLIACANVASFLLGRTSRRSHEFSLRIAIGASRGLLGTELLIDSIVISVAGGACGMLLAVWTSRVIPSLLFDQDAAHLILTPDLWSIVAASTTCVGITVVCGLLPVLVIPHSRPAAVLRRESAGSSRAIRRLRAGLGVAQLTSCFVLVVCTVFLQNGLRTALQTGVGRRLGEPILASGLPYSKRIEDEARQIAGGSGVAWASRIPGGLPEWRSFRIEPPRLPVRGVTIEAVPFRKDSLDMFELPPVAGRLFGHGDEACRAAFVNEAADAVLFDGDTVGRAIRDPADLPVEIIGVVRMRGAERGTRSRPTLHYQGTGVGSGRFLAPAVTPLAKAVLDANVVSPEYFDYFGVSLIVGQTFKDRRTSGACRVGVINQEAADLYFGGAAIGSAVIDEYGVRTEIIGVVHIPPLISFQRGVDPAIYFPRAEVVLQKMTMFLMTRQADDAALAELRRRIGPSPVIVKTLNAHLGQTALAPLRIAAAIISTCAVMAVLVSMLGLYGALNDAAQQSRRDLAIRIALGARRRHVILHVLGGGVRLAGAATLAGILGSLLLVRLLEQVAPVSGSPALWVWLAAPLVLFGSVVIASGVPARSASIVDPIAILRS